MSRPSDVRERRAADCLAGGGEMAALMRAFAWSASPLGPESSWPQSLRTAVSICLASRSPIVIYWGPEYVTLYNDAYRDILAQKHPWALGRRAQEVWAETWDVIDPMLDRVMATGEATCSSDLLLLLQRHGQAEECYFSFFFSPVRVEGGGIGGIFTAVTETTSRDRTLGKDPATFIGKVVWDEFPNAPVEEVFRRVMRERTTVTHEHYYAPLGEWVENRICPSPDGGITVFQRYVTERKRLDEDRRRREAYLADAQALSHTGSWAWHPRTRRLTWSAEHYRIFGLDPTTVNVTLELGMSMIHADDRALVERTFATAVAERGRFALDCRVVRPNGEIRHVHSIGHPLFDDVGVFSEYVGAIIDTTERRRAEETLRNDERRLRQLTEAIPQHVWSYLPDGSLEYCNQRWLDYTGLTLEQAQGDGWTACLHPDDVEPVLLAWREAWSRRRPYETEYRMRGVDGRYRRFLSRAVLVCDEEGTLLRWFGTNTDIEDRRQAEEALHRAQADLAHVTRVTTMGELAASLAHALNQPLAAIATNAGSCLRFLGRDSPNLDKANVALACIVQDAGRAGEIIASTRAFLRKSAEERVPFDVNALIGEVLVVLQPEMRGHAVLFQPFLAPDLPPVAGSRVQLQQVVLNLIMNGIESMASVRGRGRDLVVRSSRQEFEGRPAVLVAVQDSGIGFDAQGPDRLFDAFYTTKRDGLGMGLSISRSAIEAHGGRLWATPNATGGATFQFILPAHGEPAP